MAKKRSAAAKAKPARASAAVRRRKPTRKQAKHMARQEARSLPTPLNSFRLSWQVCKVLARYWKQLGGILLVYLILNIIFASGISSISSTVNSIKSDFKNLGDQAHPILAGTTGFLVLVSSAGSSSSSTGSVLQACLIIIESLAIIWALRQLLAGKKITIKQAYYNATGQLVPFLIVGLVIFIQLLPVTIGFYALSSIASALGIINGLWSFIFIILAAILAAWSFYMLSSSVFALYIVTLPDMKPRDALRSARNLVRFRRWLVLRRLLFLPIVILAAMAVIMIPLIVYATPAAAPVFYVLGVLSLLFAHSYLFSLYRGLLG